MTAAMHAPGASRASRGGLVPGFRTVSLAVLAIAIAIAIAVPAQAGPEADARQLELLTTNCVQCHARGETGAPRMGYPEDWADGRSRGEDAMLVNLVQGVRGMPPLGYCSACSEEDFRVLIRLLAGDPPGSTP